MITLEECRARDESDPLADRRILFDLKPGVIYLDGNSLGPPIKAVIAAMDRVLAEWRDRLTNGWWESGWVDLPRIAGAKLEAIVGAEAASIVCTDSTTVNLFKAVAAMCELSEGDIVTDEGNFPSDLYVLGSLSHLLGRQLRVVPPEKIMDSIDDRVGVVSLTQVDFRNGYLHDMSEITSGARQAGARIVWDLSHSVGVIPIDLAGCAVDAAVGCGYKYLNGGPGAPAFVYVSPGIVSDLKNPINGWFSHRAPFDFSINYEPAEGIDRLRTGTPHILSLVALDEALKVYEGVSIHQIRSKSIGLTSLFIELIDSEIGCEVLTPRQPADRGSQVSLLIPEAEKLLKALGDEGVIGDYRPPDVARFGFSPMYIGYEDVWRAVQAIKSVLC